MSPGVIALLGVAGFLVLVFLRMPIGFAFAIMGALGVMWLKGIGPGLALLGTAPYSWASYQGLIVLPLFALMGSFAFHSGISRDLFDAAYKWLGRLPGGLALATMLACTGFAACTGSSLASAGAMGSICYPEMKRFRYHDALSTGCIAAGGTLGIMIPPSVIFIVYGVLTQTSIRHLFIAGVLPGLMLSGMFAILISGMVVRNPELAPAGESFSWKERLVSLKGIWAMLLLVVVVIGGLYRGVFAPSEAGAIGAVASFLIGLSRRRLPVPAIINALKDSLQLTCMAMTVLIGAMMFSTFLLSSGLPDMLRNWISGLVVPPLFILMGILFLYIPLGMIIDSLPMILLTIPFVFPIIDKTLGYNPIWFGVLVCLMGQLANITPPVGMNLYILQGVSKVRLGVVIRGALPFCYVMLIAEAILIAFPQISLFLPSLME